MASSSSSSSSSSSASSSSNAAGILERFPKVVPKPYKIHYEEETTGMSKSKHHYRWKFAFYDNQNEVNTFVRHFIYFSHSKLSGKRVIRENDKEIYRDKQYFSNNFVHEWFSSDTGILYKIEEGLIDNGPVFYVNNVQYSNFQQDPSSLNNSFPADRDHIRNVTHGKYDLKYLMGTGDSSSNNNSTSSSSSNHGIYHRDVDSLFADLEEGSPLLASGSALAVRDGVCGRTPSRGPYEDSLRSTLTYSSIGGTRRDLGKYADEMEINSSKWRRYFVYLVVLATSLFVVNVVARKYPMMGLGRSTMMDEEKTRTFSSSYSVLPAGNQTTRGSGTSTISAMCNVRTKPTCSETYITVSVPPDENGKWPQGLTWAISKNGAGDLSPVNELRAIQNADYVMNEKMYSMNSDSNFTCTRYDTTLCLDGDYVISVSSAVPDQHRVVEICHQEVPIAEQLGFNTQQEACGNGFVMPPDPTVIDENSTDTEECLWGWLCPPSQWSNAVPVPTYAPTLAPTAAPNSAWKPTKNCEFLGFFCHVDTPEPTYAPSRFPTPSPVYFTAMPIAPLELPTLSPMEFHLPPWLGGPPEVDDDIAAQATNNSSDADSGGQIGTLEPPVMQVNDPKPTQSPTAPFNVTMSPSLSNPASTNSSSVATSTSRNITYAYKDVDKDDRANQLNSKTEMRRHIGAMLDAFVQKGPSMGEIVDESAVKRSKGRDESDDITSIGLLTTGISKDASLIKNTIQKQMRAEEKSLAETTNSASKSGAHAATDSRETDPEWLKHHPSYIAEKARKENDTDKRHQDVEWLRQHPSYFKEMADRNKNAANNE